MEQASLLIRTKYSHPFLMCTCQAWQRFCPFYTIVCLVVFWRMRMYRSIWRFASLGELNRIIVSSLITGVFHIVAITLLVKRMPVTYYVVGVLLLFILITLIRFSYRLYLLLYNRHYVRIVEKPVKQVMLIGAGSAGCMILRDIHRSSEIGEKVVCIIDDNPNKWNRYIDGVPVAGGRDLILKAVEVYQVIGIREGLRALTEWYAKYYR